MQRLGFWLRRTIYGLNLFAVVGVVCLLGGPYSAAKDWRDHRVTVQIAQNIDIKNAADNLSPEDFRQINCLAANMYFEARNQGQEGMAAVGDVVFNRLGHGLFPDRICQVIDEGVIVHGKHMTTGCAFSWRCVPGTYVVKDRKAFADAYEIAYNQYLYREKMPSLVGKAQYYHTSDIDPHRGVWNRVVPVKQIGAHIFYDMPNRTSSATRSGGGDFGKTKVDKRVTLR